jgi:hypothetical protein
MLKFLLNLKIYLIIYNNNNLLILKIFLWKKKLGIGDWGLGPIPNPQSPIPNPQFFNFFSIILIK